MKEEKKKICCGVAVSAVAIFILGLYCFFNQALFFLQYHYQWRELILRFRSKSVQNHIFVTSSD